VGIKLGNGNLDRSTKLETPVAEVFEVEVLAEVVCLLEVPEVPLLVLETAVEAFA